MEQYKIDSLRSYYETSKRIVENDQRAFSEIWCREACDAILELLDEAEKLPEYEYAVRWHHKPSGVTGRLNGWGDEGWGPLEEAEVEHGEQVARDKENAVDWQFEYKLVKRRLRGEIEED